MNTLIKSGRIVTVVDDHYADILIEDGEVSLIGKTLEMEADKVIDQTLPLKNEINWRMNK